MKRVERKTRLEKYIYVCKDREEKEKKEKRSYLFLTTGSNVNPLLGWIWVTTFWILSIFFFFFRASLLFIFLSFSLLLHFLALLLRGATRESFNIWYILDSLWNLIFYSSIEGSNGEKQEWNIKKKGTTRGSRSRKWWNRTLTGWNRKRWFSPHVYMQPFLFSA